MTSACLLPCTPHRCHRHRHRHPAGHMLLDACAIRSLELLTNSEGGLHGSLLHLLDRAATPAGGRKVRQFISNPLYRQACLVAPVAAAWYARLKPALCISAWWISLASSIFSADVSCHLCIVPAFAAGWATLRSAWPPQRSS